MYNQIREVDSYYTVDMLSKLPLKVINALAGYTVGGTKPTPAAAAFLAHHGKPWTVSSQANAIAASTVSKNGDTWATANIEESVWPKGAQVSYSATEIAVTKSNGEVTKIQNNPIPLAPGSITRPGLQNVAVAIASMLDLEKGEIVLVKSPTEWITRFPDKNYPIKPAGIVKVKSIFCDMYDPIYRAVHVKEGLTLRGASWVQFLMPFLVSMPIKDYWMLATVVTADFFNIVTPRKTDKGWNTVKFTSKTGVKEFVKVADLHMPGATARAAMGWDPKFHNPIVITGGIMPMQFSPSSVGASFRTAVQVMTDSMAFRGGLKRGIGYLCTGLGYAGLPSENTRRLVLELSLLLPLMRTKPVTLKVNVSDVLPIYWAVVRWGEAFGVNIDRLFFCVPMESLSKVHKDCKKRCVTSHQPGTTFLWVSPAQVPTVSASDETDTVYRDTATEFFSVLPKADFVIVTPVYSDLFFQHKVFSLGNAWDFRCVYTDHDEVTRAGVENGDSASAPVFEPLPRYTNPGKLWSDVVRDNGKMIGFVLTPRTSYHCSMNLLQRPPKAGALQMNSDGIWDYCATDVNDDNQAYEDYDSSEGPDDDNDDGCVGSVSDDEASGVDVDKMQRVGSIASATVVSNTGQVISVPVVSPVAPPVVSKKEKKKKRVQREEPEPSEEEEPGVPEDTGAGAEVFDD
jgi:hypothetical protein